MKIQIPPVHPQHLKRSFTALFLLGIFCLGGCPDEAKEIKADIQAEQNRIGHAPKKTLDDFKAKLDKANAKAAKRLEAEAPAEE